MSLLTVAAKPSGSVSDAVVSVLLLTERPVQYIRAATICASAGICSSTETLSVLEGSSASAKRGSVKPVISEAPSCTALP